MSKLNKEIKQSSKAINDSGQIRIRFSTFEELQLLKTFEKYCLSKNITKNKLYKDILISWIENQEKQSVLNDIESSIYMGLNKAVFNRSQGINKLIVQEIRPVSLETQLTNEKLNLILNLILKITSISDSTNISPSSIEELQIFKKSRKAFELATNESLKKIANTSNSSNKWSPKYQQDTINKLFEKEQEN